MSNLQTPPRIASALLCFFAGHPDFPALLGDLREEFHQRVGSSNARTARRWFWRETFRNTGALTIGELLRTPVRTFLTALVCFLAIGASAALFSYLLQHSLEDLLYNPQLYATLLLLNILPPLAMGRIGGVLVAGREWALALAFTFISVCSAAVGAWYLLFMLKVDLSPVMAVLRMVSVLRLGSFYLGSLCWRGWSAVSSAKHSA